MVSSSAMHCFLLNNDLFKLLLSDWVDFRSMGTLDTAITNRSTRITWLNSLPSLSGGDFDSWMHGHLSMRWLIARGIRTSSIQINSNYSDSITHLTLDGIDAARLVHVDLDSCTSITDAAVLVLGLQCPLLQSIDLGFCDSVSDVGILAVGQGCPLLQRINLYACDSVTDTGISALGRGCPLLQSIDLYSCVRITDAGISALGHGCPLLHSIYIYNCLRITGEGVSALRDKNPSLEVHR